MTWAVKVLVVGREAACLVLRPWHSWGLSCLPLCPHLYRHKGPPLCSSLKSESRRRVGMLIRERLLFLSHGGLRDFSISQHFPEVSTGEGKLLLGAVGSGSGSAPLGLAWCLYGEASLTFVARGCFASSEGRRRWRK